MRAWILLAVLAASTAAPVAWAQAATPEDGDLRLDLGPILAEAVWGEPVVLQATVHNDGPLARSVRLSPLGLADQSQWRAVLADERLTVAPGSSATVDMTWTFYGSNVFGWSAPREAGVRLVELADGAVLFQTLDVAVFGNGVVLQGNANATLAPGDNGTLRLYATALRAGLEHAVTLDGPAAAWVRDVRQRGALSEGEPDHVIELDVAVPAGTALGRYPLTVRATHPTSGASWTTSANVTVAAESAPRASERAPPRVTLSAYVVEALENDTFSIDVTVTNPTTETQVIHWLASSSRRPPYHDWSSWTGVQVAPGRSFTNTLTWSLPVLPEGPRLETIDIVVRSTLGDVRVENEVTLAVLPRAPTLAPPETTTLQAGRLAQVRLMASPLPELQQYEVSVEGEAAAWITETAQFEPADADRLSQSLWHGIHLRMQPPANASEGPHDLQVTIRHPTSGLTATWSGALQVNASSTNASVPDDPREALPESPPDARPEDLPDPVPQDPPLPPQDADRPDASDVPDLPLAPILGLAGVGSLAVGSIAAHRRWPFAFAALYARIAPARVLEHPVRRRVMDEIVREPGLSVSELQRRAGLTNGGVTHHVATLERSKHVVTLLDGPLRRVYPAGDHRPTPAGPLPDRFARLLADRGAMGLSEAARALGVSRQSLHYHARRLLAEGRIETARDGSETRYRLRG